MAESSNTRIVWIDYLRCIAIGCVVLCHSVEGNFELTIQQKDVIIQYYNLPLLFLAIGRLGVPFFLIISGFLLLDRKDYNIKEFYKEKCLYLFGITEFWIVIYWIWDKFIRDNSTNWIQLFKELLFFAVPKANHLWYMPIILGIYIFIPLISVALNKIDIKYVEILFVIGVIYSFVIPSLNIILKIHNRQALTMNFEPGFSGKSYGLYLIAGYLLKKGTFKKFRMKRLFFCSVGGILGTAFLEFISYNNDVAYNAWYDCVFILIAAIAIAEILSRICLKNLYSIEKLSYYSFGIYLVHNIVRYFWSDNISFMISSKMFSVVLCWIFTLTISYIFTYVISKIPNVGKKILYLK